MWDELPYINPWTFDNFMEIRKRSGDGLAWTIDSIRLLAEMFERILTDVFTASTGGVNQAPSCCCCVLHVRRKPVWASTMRPPTRLKAPSIKYRDQGKPPTWRICWVWSGMERDGLRHAALPKIHHIVVPQRCPRLWDRKKRETNAAGYHWTQANRVATSITQCTYPFRLRT